MSAKAATARQASPGLRRRTLPAPRFWFCSAPWRSTPRSSRSAPPSDVRNAVFSPRDYGKSEFPKVQADVEARAVDAATLATAIAKDKADGRKGIRRRRRASDRSSRSSSPASSARASRASTTSPSTACRETLTVRVQTGPAINGTDLRDATGKIDVRPVHQPDRVPGRRLGAEQRDEEGRCWRTSTPAR